MRGRVIIRAPEIVGCVRWADGMCVYFPCNSDVVGDLTLPTARKVRRVRWSALHEGYDFGKIFPLFRIPLNSGIQERDFGYFSRLLDPA